MVRFRAGSATRFAGLNDMGMARRNWTAAANFKGDFQEMSVRTFSEMTYFAALSWEKLGRPAKAKQLLRGLLAYALKLQKTRAKIDYFATSLPTMYCPGPSLTFALTRPAIAR